MVLFMQVSAESSFKKKLYVDIYVVETVIPTLFKDGPVNVPLQNYQLLKLFHGLNVKLTHGQYGKWRSIRDLAKQD
jgi:hypothetical protein